MRRAAIAAAKTVAVLAAMAGYLYVVYKWIDFTKGRPVAMVTPLVAIVVGITFYGCYLTTKKPPEDQP